jgi:hypothetical protein
LLVVRRGEDHYSTRTRDVPDGSQGLREHRIIQVLDHLNDQNGVEGSSFGHEASWIERSQEEVFVSELASHLFNRARRGIRACCPVAPPKQVFEEKAHSTTEIQNLVAPTEEALQASDNDIPVLVGEVPFGILTLIVPEPGNLEVRPIQTPVLGFAVCPNNSRRPIVSLREELGGGLRYGER